MTPICANLTYLPKRCRTAGTVLLALLLSVLYPGAANPAHADAEARIEALTPNDLQYILRPLYDFFWRHDPGSPQLPLLSFDLCSPFLRAKS